jgi:hypothetical protein
VSMSVLMGMDYENAYPSCACHALLYCPLDDSNKSQINISFSPIHWSRKISRLSVWGILLVCLVGHVNKHDLILMGRVYMSHCANSRLEHSSKASN